MSNFGELPFGEIPEPLKYVKPFNMTTLANGIRVCSEISNSPVATVSVHVGAGSRNEGLETSGSSYLLHHMLQRGNSSYSKDQLYGEIANMGAQFKSDVARE